MRKVPHSETSPVVTTRKKVGRPAKASDVQASSGVSRSTARVRKTRNGTNRSAGQPSNNINNSRPTRRRQAAEAVPGSYEQDILGLRELEQVDDGKWQLNEVIFMAMLVTTLLGLGFIIGKVF